MREAISQEQLRETTRENIRNGSLLDVPYVIMNTLAAVIACYGLFANSPAVVIGAMIIAVLLGPITGVALALTDGDTALLRKALTAIFGGAIAVMTIAFILGLIHKDIPITNEIMARTAPNIVDLMVALAGGAAGAYATISPRLSVSFVGVAIATALVPPLSAASILVARGEYRLALGALLLAFTNMVAIQFASSVVFWLTGFNRITHTAGLQMSTFIKRNTISIVILLILAVILAFNLRNTISKQLFETSVRGVLKREVSASPLNYLEEVRFEKMSDTTIVRAVVRGPSQPSIDEVRAMEEKLPHPPDGTMIELRIRFVNATIINRDGVLSTDTKLGPHE
jgi:uncharacterized hydrophobic protein (TIGR00271 family)